LDALPAQLLHDVASERRAIAAAAARAYFSGMRSVAPRLVALWWLGVAGAAVGPVGCGGTNTVGSGTLDDTETTATIALARQWLLVGDGLTEGASRVDATVALPESFGSATVGIDEGPTTAFEREPDGTTSVSAPLGDLAPGEHQLVVRSANGDRVLGRASFQLSAALYVVVSADWDDSRFADANLARIEGLRAAHPGMRISQFFAPYHYTDPELTDARKAEIDAWIKEQRDLHGDEIGLHIHGWCHFINTTSVPCRTAETFYQDDGSGYTTIVAAYTEDEMATILEASIAMFESHGLGRPTSFRAGGWTTGEGTMRALVRTGFTLESSAVPPHRLADWQGYELYDWNMEHWAGITETSQPYYPLATHVAEADPAHGLPILEVPDNGVLVDYVTGADMRAIYEQNHPGGGPLAVPTLYQIGHHPPNFSSDYFDRLDEALDLVDEHSFARDAGPAVYVTLSELAAVWPP
jgi:hypothetical protein